MTFDLLLVVVCCIRLVVGWLSLAVRSIVGLLCELLLVCLALFVVCRLFMSCVGWWRVFGWLCLGCWFGFC